MRPTYSLRRLRGSIRHISLKWLTSNEFWRPNRSIEVITHAPRIADLKIHVRSGLIPNQLEKPWSLARGGRAHCVRSVSKTAVRVPFCPLAFAPVPLARAAPDAVVPAFGMDALDYRGRHLRVESAVLDGEIACVDDAGQSSAICFSAGVSAFIAFDLLYLNGKDLRTLLLIETQGSIEETARAEAFTNALS
jgi:hypothetical protein